MRIKNYFLLMAVLLIFTACGANQQTEQTVENPILPPAEVANGTCADQDRAVKECSTALIPVCGQFDPSQVMCFKAPCQVTYTNACEACRDPLIEKWTDGYCQGEKGIYEIK